MALLLLFPTFCGFVHLTQRAPALAVNENRYRKEPPPGSPLQAVTGDGAYFTAWEEYYNDNFGARDLFIRTKNQLEYSLLRYSNGLYFDDAGNMYYKSTIDEQQIHVETMPDEDIKALLASYAAVIGAFEAQGIEVVLLIPPLKNTVLEYTGTPVKRPEPNGYEKMDSLMAETFPGHYFPLLDILQTANETAPVFYKTDFHWNDYGAGVAFGNAVNFLAQREGAVPPWTGEYEILPMDMTSGGQNDFLSILFPPKETSVTISAVSTCLPVDAVAPFIAMYESPLPAPLEGAALFIGDSFTPAAIMDMNETSSGVRNAFDKVYLLHWDGSKGILNQVPTDVRYVFIELIEVDVRWRGPSLDAFFLEPDPLPTHEVA